MQIDLGNVDWGLLTRQKRTLVRLAAKAVGNTKEHLCGIIHLIDHIQDRQSARVDVDVYIYDGVRYVAVDGSTCDKCSFCYLTDACRRSPPCSATSRRDRRVKVWVKQEGQNETNKA